MTETRRFVPVRTPRKITFLVVEPVQPLDLFGPLEVFTSANRQSGSAPPFTIEVLSWGAPVMSGESSVSIVAHRRAPAQPPRTDTLIVVAGYSTRSLSDPRLSRWLSRAHGRARRVASICVAAFLLARAGLLDGRRATTHWMCAEELSRLFPKVRVDADRIWVRDGSVFTSAGVSTGIDLALALVSADLGHALALSVARTLVVFLQRPGTQAQFSAVLEAQRAQFRALRELTAYVVEHPAEEHSVQAMAARARMSPRNFTRTFTREVRTTPARFVLRVRLEAAQRLLMETDEGAALIAARSGFQSADVMARAFQRVLGTTPAQYRKTFQDAGMHGSAARERTARSLRSPRASAKRRAARPGTLDTRA